MPNRSCYGKIALAPTGRILFYSRYPAMIGVRFGTEARSAYSQPFFGCCRSLWQRSSISLNFVVGMALRCKRSIPVTPRSILTILALGYWVLPPRPGIACDHLPRCAFAICELPSNVSATGIHHLVLVISTTCGIYLFWLIPILC